MIDNHIAYNGETEEAYLWKLGSAKELGLIDLDWKDIADLMNKYFRADESEYRTEAAYRKPYQQAKRFFDRGVFSDFAETKYISELREAKEELAKERYKISTEKLEYNKFKREEARDELILEKIEKAVKALDSYKVPVFEPLPKTSNEKPKEWVLTFADAHYGIEFEVPNLNGGTINVYNPEIFEQRMQDLFNKTVRAIKLYNITKLNIWELGDGLQGILRLNSQLMKLRFGIIDSAINYGNILGKWLNDLSKYADIEFQMVADSNHNQLRICNAPKNAFPEENMSKVILAVIKARLANNSNIKIKENPTGFNFINLLGYNILGVHGELKNVVRSVGDFSVAYNTPINYIVGAHIHHAKEEEVGIDYEYITIPSLIGVDPYAMSLVRTSRAGAKLIGFTKGEGKTTEETFRLN